MSVQLHKQDLSKGWRWVKLGALMPRQVASLDPAKQSEEPFSLYSIPAFDRGTPDLVRGKQIGSTKQVVIAGDVLLSKIVPHIRRTWVVGALSSPQQIASTEWIVLRTPDADSLFLKYALVDDTFHAAFMRTTSGVGGSLTRARPALVANIQIPLPPLPEQRRIAAILQEQMAAVDKARAVAVARLEAAQALPSAFLRAAFPQSGQPLPADWRRIPLGEVIEILSAQVDPKDPRYKHLPHVNGENIESGTGRLLATRTAAEDGMTSGKYLFDAGVVLYSKLRPYLKKAAAAEFRGLCSADIYPISPKLNEMTSQFLLQLLISEEFTKYAERESQRARMPKLNRTQLFAYDAPLPPLPTQHRMTALLQAQMSAAAYLRTLAEADLATINALPAALLRQAFSGEV